MDKNIKTTLIIAGVVLLLGVIIFLAAFFTGKKKGKDAQTKNAELPPAEKDWGKELTEEESRFVRSLTNRLYQDMKGFGLNHDLILYREYLSSRDRIFVAVYNDFNDLYFKDGDGTLKEWISGEWIGIVGTQIINRMNTLDLK